MAKVSKHPQLFFLTLVLGFASPVHASGEDWEREAEGTSFVYGGECNQLSQLAHRSIVAIVHSEHLENFSRFCKAEGVYSCDDFTALLGGLGTLEGNGSIDCRFVPNPIKD